MDKAAERTATALLFVAFALVAMSLMSLAEGQWGGLLGLTIAALLMWPAKRLHDRGWTARG